MPDTNNNTLKYRVVRLEEDMGEVRKSLKDIKENDLHHIQLILASLKTRVTVTAVLNIGAIIVAIIIGLIVRYIFP